jgi:YHS domain-containing protein
MTMCPVCDVEIEEETLTMEEGYGSESYFEAQTEYQGEIYQFCCSEHKEEFESSPEEFL